MDDTVRLSEGFTLRDVLSSQGASFEVMPTNMTEAELQPAVNAFEGSDHISHVRADVIDTDGDQYSTPFERHHKLMTNVTPDGSVKKTISRHGAGDPVPPHSYVTFHYNAYAEYQDEPHDSSVLRGKPWRVKLDSGSLLPGLEIGIKSMRKHEKADILVQPHLAFGKIGSPPRIPPNAEILYEVELLEVTHEPSAELLEEIDAGHLAGSHWDRAEKQVRRLLLEGNDHHKNKNFFKAVRVFKSATKLAVNCNLKDEKEEMEQSKLLVKLYLNMALGNLALKNYNDVCINCREALALKIIEPTDDTGRHNYVKAHFLWGKALTALNELDSAQHHLKEALAKNRDDPHVHEALQMLNDKKKKFKESDRKFWRKALDLKESSASSPQEIEDKSTTTVASPVQDSAPKPSCWQKQLSNFKNNPDEKRIKLPGRLDPDELDAVCAEAKALDLKVDRSCGYLSIYK